MSRCFQNEASESPHKQLFPFPKFLLGKNQDSPIEEGQFQALLIISGVSCSVVCRVVLHRWCFAQKGTTSGEKLFHLRQQYALFPFGVTCSRHVTLQINGAGYSARSKYEYFFLSNEVKCRDFNP